MFQVDLKTSATRRPVAVEESPAAATAGAFLPVAVVLAVLIGTLWIVGSSWDASLARRRADVAGLEAAVAEHRQRLAEISGKRRALFGIQRQEIYWSDQLRMLTEKISDKIWISRIGVATSGGTEDTPLSRVLTLEAGVLSSESEGNLDLIGQFIQALQADARFRDAFADIALESVTRGGDDAYSLTFVLKAPFRG
ncbi:MAG: hypothetical protein ACREQ9_13355 [Candidatus Binatia bacterium]